MKPNKVKWVGGDICPKKEFNPPLQLRTGEYVNLIYVILEDCHDEGSKTSKSSKTSPEI